MHKKLEVWHLKRDCALCFHPLVFGLDIFIFTKLMLINVISKINKFKRWNSRNNEYIYVICSIINFFFFFFDNIRFWFELVNQKMLKMKIFKMAHLTYLVIFHLKMIICHNVNLSHTYGHHHEKHSFVIW
jgi:hypothetical protein